ncbi:hypothetical protein AB0C33_06825 [Nonomuraea sp. NPDC048881]|uniref:hypothetical protein n=1 Tax=Nonomuraea sp. NPDC048881 TaxID=3155030 RepID=UPI0033EFE7FC
MASAWRHDGCHVRDEYHAGRMIDLPRLTVRSDILSVLVSHHPGRPTSAQIVRAAGVFGINESATRDALTRLVSGGDLTHTRDRFPLSESLPGAQAAGAARDRPGDAAVGGRVGAGRRGRRRARSG